MSSGLSPYEIGRLQVELEIAKMNLILAGDGHTNILNDNFLNYKSYIKKFYDISIGNMPFGKKINEPEFVNGFLDIIKDGSYSIFIVPSGIIGTTSKNDYIAIREKLLVLTNINFMLIFGLMKVLDNLRNFLERKFIL